MTTIYNISIPKYYYSKTGPIRIFDLIRLDYEYTFFKFNSQNRFLRTISIFSYIKLENNDH